MLGIAPQRSPYISPVSLGLIPLGRPVLKVTLQPAIRIPNDPHLNPLQRRLESAEAVLSEARSQAQATTRELEACRGECRELSARVQAAEEAREAASSEARDLLARVATAESAERAAKERAERLEGNVAALRAEVDVAKSELAGSLERVASLEREASAASWALRAASAGRRGVEATEAFSQTDEPLADTDAARARPDAEVARLRLSLEAALREVWELKRECAALRDKLKKAEERRRGAGSGDGGDDDRGEGGSGGGSNGNSGGNGGSNGGGSNGGGSNGDGGNFGPGGGGSGFETPYSGSDTDSPGREEGGGGHGGSSTPRDGESFGGAALSAVLSELSLAQRALAARERELEALRSAATGEGRGTGGALPTGDLRAPGSVTADEDGFLSTFSSAAELRRDAPSRSGRVAAEGGPQGRRGADADEGSTSPGVGPEDAEAGDLRSQLIDCGASLLKERQATASALADLSSARTTLARRDAEVSELRTSLLAAEEAAERSAAHLSSLSSALVAREGEIRALEARLGDHPAPPRVLDSSTAPAVDPAIEALNAALEAARENAKEARRARDRTREQMVALEADLLEARSREMEDKAGAAGKVDGELEEAKAMCSALVVELAAQQEVRLRLCGIASTCLGLPVC